MATITIQKKLSAMTEQIATAEQLEGVFNNPETYRKVCQIREARKNGDLKKANSIKNSLEESLLSLNINPFFSYY